MDNNVIKDLALALRTKGQEHHLRGDIEDAIECYTTSLGLNPTGRTDLSLDASPTARSAELISGEEF